MRSRATVCSVLNLTQLSRQVSSVLGSDLILAKAPCEKQLLLPGGTLVASGGTQIPLVIFQVEKIFCYIGIFTFPRKKWKARSRKMKSCLTQGAGDLVAPEGQ